MMQLATWVFISLLFLFFRFCTSIDTLTSGQAIKDGDLLVSKRETFALGFFSPGNSRNRYVGIWYKKIPVRTIVWVANRNNPIKGTTGVLSINKDGDLVIYSYQSVPFWQTNISTATTASSSYSSQLLDSGNLVLFRVDNASRLVVWQSFDYPTHVMLPKMKLGLDRKTGLDRFLTSWKSPDDPSTGEYSYRMDPKGFPRLVLLKGSTPRWQTGPWINNNFNAILVPTVHSTYSFSYIDNSDELSVMYDFNDFVVFIAYLDESGFVGSTWYHNNEWNLIWSVPKDQCDYYGHCGAYGICDPNNGFAFECSCLPGYEPTSPPDWYSGDGSAGCTRKRTEGHMCGHGEGFVKITNAKVPNTLKAQLAMNLKVEECKHACLGNCSCLAYASGDKGECFTWNGELMDIRRFSNGGLDLYIRVDAIELAQHSKKPHNLHGKEMAIVLTSVIVMLLLSVSLVCWLIKRRTKGLANTRSKSLGWRRRLDIIVGIAQGLLYLHRDSRLRVIHRDLKASNVLLDDDLNPKISDFGIARAFGGDQSSAKTRRVAGTYGYMSPEYAIDGLFSMKSDVFSFGVIVLEILSCERNRLFHHCGHDFNLLGHAWNLWIEGKASELLNPQVEGSIPMSEILRCMQVGLLCVQKCPKDRPTMSSVLLMLITETAILPQPKQPGFYVERIPEETYYMGAESISSVNEVTVTRLEAR